VEKTENVKKVKNLGYKNPLLSIKIKMHLFKIILSVLFLSTAVLAIAQDETMPENPLASSRGIRVPGIVVDGDTFPSFTINPVYVFEDYVFKNAKAASQWTRLKYNVKKAYPYALIAEARLKEFDATLATMTDEKEKKAYLDKAEKKLKEEFEDQLKDLTISQGQILIKLIDRQTGHTSYELVKRMRGKFSAFMWQSVAVIFGENLKEEYDGKGEDQMIEQAIRLVEAGMI
jgi:hypothetical protein